MAEHTRRLDLRLQLGHGLVDGPQRLVGVELLRSLEHGASEVLAS